MTIIDTHLIPGQGRYPVKVTDPAQRKEGGGVGNVEKGYRGKDVWGRER